VDGQNISGKDSTDLLNELFLFLSFCHGLQTGPILTELIGEDGKERRYV
jgi:hypothetical protein